MEEEQTNKPTEGSWANLSTEESERKRKVEFEFDKAQIVTFSPEFSAPKELPNKDGSGVFYIFDVVQDGEEKVVMTSAWTLMKGLKSLEPLAGKTVKITKSMKDGKQNYSVEDTDNIEVPVEKPGQEE